jgi:cytochrome c-type biogenesis protein CcsB
MKKIIIALYALIVIVLGGATFVEHIQGRDFALQHIYGAWWFSLLWALLTAFGVAWIVRQHMRRWPILLLHASFVLILAGALLTHLTSKQGVIHLRMGETTDEYYEAATETGMRVAHLPFQLRLDNFNIIYHEGTQAVADYETHFTIVEGQQQTEARVSMNNIFSHRGYRLYQSSYDEDQRGSVLAMNADPWGIPVTYVGYALLFFSLVYMLIDPRGTFRRLLRSPLLQRAALLFLILHCSLFTCRAAAPTLPREQADAFAQLHILYNDRICPIETYALDFTKKLYGKRHYGSYSATQVLLGFIFWGDEWSKEPIVKIKRGDLKSQLDLPAYCSVDFFFNEAMGGYIIGPYLKEYYNGQQNGFHKQAAQIDEKLSLVMDLRRGTPLKLFPANASSWIAPTDALPADINPADSAYITTVFNNLYQDALSGNYAHFGQIVKTISDYQHKHGAASLPTATKDKAENLYNHIPFATILFMFNLTLGFLALFCCIWMMTRQKKSSKKWETTGNILLLISFLALTFCIALRWIVKGTIPMSNGYETMLITAWFVMAITLLFNYQLSTIHSQLSALLLTFGFLLSGFFLLVSHISQMDPQITHMMPVLNSPLLSLHVSIIMMSYALVSLTFICGIVALLLKGISKLRGHREKTAIATQMESLAVLSRIFLYPALTTMGLGIFIGAIWANVSWGNYWSWDPKETWALITFMVYAVVVHTQSLPVFRRPLAYHIYMVLAFLTILMTYFGVNYFLGGMHSYA